MLFIVKRDYKMGSPQKEHGFTPIANEILENLALLKIRLSHYEWKGLMFIFRKTYGYHQKETVITNQEFIKGLNIHKCHIKRTLQLLIDRNIIKKVTPLGNSKNNKYSFQKLVEEYKKLPNGVTHKKLPPLVTKVTPLGNKKLPPLVTPYSKDTKDRKIRSFEPVFPVLSELLGNPAFAKDWTAFLEMRKTRKKPATLRAQELILRKLEKQGDIEIACLILQQSITNSWVDVYPLKIDFTPERKFLND